METAVVAGSGCTTGARAAFNWGFTCPDWDPVTYPRQVTLKHAPSYQPFEHDPTLHIGAGRELWQGKA